MTTHLWAIGWGLSLLGTTAVLAAEIEGFDGGTFTNPFFQHQFEFDDPCKSHLDAWLESRTVNRGLDTADFGSRLRPLRVPCEPFRGVGGG